MKVTKEELDRIDLKIIDVLKKDGRITYQKLSELVNLTPRPCLERVKKLERAGIITGYAAIIKRDPIERAVIVLAQVSLDQSGRASQRAFEEEVRQREEVLECRLVSGAFDYFVRLACRDLDHYRTLTSAWLVSKKFKIDKIVSSPELQVIKAS